MRHRVLTLTRAGRDAPEGRALLHSIQGAPELPVSCHPLMECAYEGNETRQLALDLGFIPVVPPHPNRIEPWRPKKALYRRRNEIDHLALLSSWKHYVSSVNTP
jgi:hypothetical protein